MSATYQFSILTFLLPHTHKQLLHFSNTHQFLKKTPDWINWFHAKQLIAL